MSPGHQQQVCMSVKEGGGNKLHMEKCLLQISIALKALSVFQVTTSESSCSVCVTFGSSSLCGISSSCSA